MQQHSRKHLMLLHIIYLQRFEHRRIVLQTTLPVFLWKTRRKLAISYARKHRVQKRKEKSEILKEISKRIAQNKQKKNMTDLNRIEGTLTKLESTAELPSKFPELDICKIEDLTQLLEGRCIGKNIIHSWYDEETQGKKAYYGRFEKQLSIGLGTGLQWKSMTMQKITNSQNML